LDTGRTGEESAAGGLAEHLEERLQLQSSSFPYFQTLGHSTSFRSASVSMRNGMLAFRAESMGFNLAADFLYSIVISVDFMTFKRVTFGVLGRGIDQHLCCFVSIVCNSLKSNTLGV
jgi:hypothetical protein